jgi:hypothetical protein
MFTKSVFYSTLLEMVKIVVLKADQRLCTYFVIPSSVNSVSKFGEEISESFINYLPKQLTKNGLGLIDSNGLSEIRNEGILYSFEFLSGQKFYENYVSKK